MWLPFTMACDLCQPVQTMQLGAAVGSAGAGTQSVGLSPDGRNVLGADVVNGGIVRLSWPGHREFLSVTSLTTFCQK